MCGWGEGGITVIVNMVKYSTKKSLFMIFVKSATLGLCNSLR